MSRPGHLSNSALISATVVATVCLLIWAIGKGQLPAAWRTPGTITLQWVGVAGTVLLLVPTFFAFAKRTGQMQRATAWVSAHALCALAGTVLIVIHSAGHLAEPPALLLGALLGLLVLGVWARVAGAARMANTFGTKPRGFAAPSPELRERLAALLAEKTALLATLEPKASEATFSPRLKHWLTQPGKTRRYQQLVRAESVLVGQRASVGKLQAWWRPLHLALSTLFILGLCIHVIVVTFFAGWVAEGREITWWHLTAW